MNTTRGTRKETIVTWLALGALLIVLGLAGGQDRAGERMEARARASAIHEAGR